jgi:hypothetical protein
MRAFERKLELTPRRLAAPAVLIRVSGAEASVISVLQR